MSKKSVQLKHRIWDIAPFLLLAVLILQLLQSGLTLYQTWQAPGSNASLKSEFRQAFEKMQSTLSAIPSRISPQSDKKNSHTGSLAMIGGESVAFSKLRAEDSKAILGVDVSSYQGAIDWGRLKAAGVNFAYIKATEGATVADKDFTKNWQEAKVAGIVRGAYHVYSTTSAIEDQISNFQKTLEKAGDTGELPAALDLEVALVSKQNMSAAESAVLTWLKAMGKLNAKPSVIYGSLSLFNGYFGGTVPGNATVWLADYSSGPQSNGEKWPKWKIWQFSDKVTIDGIEGYVDVNLANSLW